MSCNCGMHGTSNCITLVPIFSSLSHEEMMEVASITAESTYTKGDMVYMAGEVCDRLYVIHEGRVKISRISLNGKEQVIRMVGPGEFMGELSIFSPKPMTDNAEIMENTVMCIIEENNLKEIMKKYPSIAFKVMEELSNRLDKAENLIEDINHHSVETRLAQALIKIADKNNQVILNMTKGEFASSIGMSQETLSRKLTKFQEQGLIAQDGNRIIKLKDIEGLSDI